MRQLVAGGWWLVAGSAYGAGSRIEDRDRRAGLHGPEPDFSHHRAARHWAWNRGVESVYEKGSEEIENHFFIAFLSCSQEVVIG